MGLWAKVYCHDTVLLDRDYNVVGHGSEVKKLKGLKKAVVQQDVSMEDYRDSLQPIDAVMPDDAHGMVTLRSRRHVLHTERLVKRSLSSCNAKRHVLPCGVHTLAFGHRRLREGPVHVCPYTEA